MNPLQAIAYLLSTTALAAIVGVGYLELSEPLKVQGGTVQHEQLSVLPLKNQAPTPTPLNLTQYQGEWSVYFKKVGEDPTINFQTDYIYHGASVTKIITAVAILQQVDQKKMSLDETIGDTNLRSLLTAMINRSDNDSWDYLNNRIGFPNMQEMINNIGMKKTNVGGNQTTTADMGLFLEQLAEGKLLSDNSTKFLLTLMTKTETENRISAGLPAGAEIFHKTGTFGEEALHDAAIIKYQGETYVLIIFGRKTNWEEGAKTIQEITRGILGSEKTE